MPDYGNVPEEDVAAIQEAVRIAASISGRIPASAPEDWRTEGYEILVNGILNDWVINGTTELSEEDESDLSSLTALAVDTALKQREELRDTTFRIVLENVMHDWSQNWNVEEE